MVDFESKTSERESGLPKVPAERVSFPYLDGSPVLPLKKPKLIPSPPSMERRDLGQPTADTA
jgi:hypothetical protein